jgi:cytoskeleton-associated protein 5
VFKVIQILAEKSSTFGKPSAALCIGQLTDKLGDMKLKGPSGETLTTIAEKTSLAFVLTQGMSALLCYTDLRLRANGQAEGTESSSRRNDMDQTAN